MSSRKKMYRGRASLEARPDADPRFFETAIPSVRDHKVGKLCSQVFRTLSCAFGELQDDVLRDLVVYSVTPAPDASRLLVCVYFPNPSPGMDAGEIVGRLERARGFLRSEVAGAINRKRTPELQFQLVVPGESEHDGQD